MTEFLTAIAAGVAVGLWNKYILNGGWKACLEPAMEETEDCDSSTSSAITLDVHTHT